MTAHDDSVLLAHHRKLGQPAVESYNTPVDIAMVKRLHELAGEMVHVLCNCLVEQDIDAMDTLWFTHVDLWYDIKDTLVTHFPSLDARKRFLATWNADPVRVHKGDVGSKDQLAKLLLGLLGEFQDGLGAFYRKGTTVRWADVDKWFATYRNTMAMARHGSPYTVFFCLHVAATSQAQEWEIRKALYRKLACPLHGQTSREVVQFRMATISEGTDVVRRALTDEQMKYVCAMLVIELGEDPPAFGEPKNLPEYLCTLYNVPGPHVPVVQRQLWTECIARPEGPKRRIKVNHLGALQFYALSALDAYDYVHAAIPRIPGNVYLSLDLF